ncbi:MAG: fused MFS/spermidine synthase [Nitrospinae bacterium]|nr:fused MFS/spermidine synthase [Nitrospinota bacterium]
MAQEKVTGMATPVRRGVLSSSRESPVLSFLIFGCFLLSGATGLVYQVVWLRLLIHVFGGTTLAVSTLLTAFLGGLALGSYLFGRYVDRLLRPGHTLVLYAVLELGIGLYGVLTLGFFHQTFLGPIWQALSTVFASYPFLSYLLRFVFVVVVLLVPTVCMGATLPVLSKFMATMRQHVVFDVGKLYTINTWGAVLGTLGAGFYLLPSFGITRTIVITAIVNGLIALAGLTMYFFWRPEMVQEPADPPQSSPVLEAVLNGEGTATSPPSDTFSTRTVRIVLLCFALSGFTALLLEVAWTRILTLILGSSSYAFTTMLGTFLVGLALGSYLMTHLSVYIKRPILVLAVTQVLLGLSVFASLFLFAELPWWYVVLARQYQKEWSKFLLSHLGLAACVMFLPTLLSGMMFPLVVSIHARRARTVGTRVGEIYAINTLGSICGSFMTGFVLIPLLSIHWTILLGMVISISLGRKLLALDLVESRPGRPRPLLYKSLVNSAYVVIIVAVLVFQPGWKRNLMTSGVFVYYTQKFQQNTREQFLAEVAENPQRELLFYKEGLATVVSVEKSPTANAIYLKNNGKGEGGVPIDAKNIHGGGDMVTQVLLSELPLLLHNGTPENVLVIGFGTGTTAGSALNAPDVKRVTIAELEAAVLEAAPHFRLGNGDPLSKANLRTGRVRPVVTDGRNYLLTTDEMFDIIISQPAEPWVSGAADLFTREYWQLGRDHLKPHGLFCQWIQLYSIDTDNLSLLLKTFASVFPETFIFRPGSAGELLLIGAHDPLQLDVARIEARLANPEQKKDLGRIGLVSAVDVLSQLLLVPPDVARFTLYERVNTDDNMLVAYGTPKTIDRFLFPIRELFDELGKAIHAEKTAYLAHYGRSQDEERRFLLDLVASYKKKVSLGPPAQLQGSPYIRSALQIIDQLTATSALPEIHVASGALHALIGETAKAQEEFTRVFSTAPKTAASFIARGDLYASRKEPDKAVAEYGQAVQLEPHNTTALIRLGLTRLLQKEFEEAHAKLAEALKLEPDNADAYAALGNYYQMRQQFSEAAASYQQATERDRYNLAAYDNLGKIYYAAKYYGKAYIEFDAVRRLNPYYPEPYYYMGKILAMNKNQQAIAYLAQYLQLHPTADKAQEVRDEIKQLQEAAQQKSPQPSS